MERGLLRGARRFLVVCRSKALEASRQGKARQGKAAGRTGVNACPAVNTPASCVACVWTSDHACEQQSALHEHCRFISVKVLERSNLELTTCLVGHLNQIYCKASGLMWLHLATMSASRRRNHAFDVQKPIA